MNEFRKLMETIDNINESISVDTSKFSDEELQGVADWWFEDHKGNVNHFPQTDFETASRRAKRSYEMKYQTSYGKISLIDKK